jgi:hypothetical protein
MRGILLKSKVMKIFEFEVKEMLSRIIEITAENENEAYEKVKEMYQNEEIVLDNTDYLDTEIKKFENE